MWSRPMITINLMPRLADQESSTRTTVNGQLGVGGAVLFLVLLGCWWWSTALLQERDDLVEQKNAKEQMLTTVGSGSRNDEIEEKRRVLRARSQLLAGNHAEKFLSVRVLDEISRSLDPLGLWLVALSIDEREVSIEGRALTRSAVSQFVKALEETSIFGEVKRLELRPQNMRAESLHQFVFIFTTES